MSSLVEVKISTLRNSKILEAAVIGVPDGKWGEVGKVLIVLKDGETMTEEEAIGFLKGKLARYKLPKLVEFTEEFPKTASGKIMKAELKRRYACPKEVLKPISKQH